MLEEICEINNQDILLFISEYKLSLWTYVKLNLFANQSTIFIDDPV